MKTLLTTKLRALLLYNVTGSTQAGEQGVSIDILENLFKARAVFKTELEGEIGNDKKLKTDEEVKAFFDSIREIKCEMELEDAHFGSLFDRFNKIQWRVEALEVYGDEIFNLKKDMNDTNSNAAKNKKKVEEATKAAAEAKKA